MSVPSPPAAAPGAAATSTAATVTELSELVARGGVLVLSGAGLSTYTFAS